MKKIFIRNPFLFAVFFFSSINLFGQTIHYVTTSGAGAMNGTSWANASSNLQNMIDASLPNDEVWVKAGTYKPTSFPSGCSGCSSNKDYTFVLKDSVKVYGGFNGTETLLVQRNYVANLTTLSGDFNNDDLVSGSGITLTISNNIENAFHVIISIMNSDETLLDGVTVKGGNSSSSGGISISSVFINHHEGAGICNYLSSSTLKNCFFEENKSSAGGGMYNYESNVNISNCVLNNNSASTGGGIYNYLSNATIDSCTFSNNYAGYSGGGICNYSNSPVVSNSQFDSNYSGYEGGGISNQSFANVLINKCNFANNKADYDGGGIANQSYSTATISHCNFINNQTEYEGGGIVNQSHSIAIVSNCNFINNHTDYGGAGIENQSFSHSLISNCIFKNNSANYFGGGINNNTHSASSIINNAFIGNSANYYGGGIANFNIDSPIVISNCTFSENSSTFGGGAIYIPYEFVSINNSIFWNNLGGGIQNIYTTAGSTSVTYSIIQGGYPGVGNININPLFANPSDPDGSDNIWRTTDDGFGLQAFSPAINASNPSTTTPSSDITNYLRVGVFDCGAYEYEPKSSALPVQLLYFKVKCEGKHNYLSWETITEINNDYFDIERSKDGIEFVKIGKVLGASNITITNAYEFYDKEPLEAISYYRLKQVDFDGNYKYSDIISISGEKEDNYLIYPNPTKDEIKILNIEGLTKYKVVNMLGEIIMDGEIETNEGINLNGLPKGIFCILLGNQRISFMKE